MEVKLWHSKDTKQWRWHVMDVNPHNYGIGDKYQVGEHDSLNDAFEDIKHAVEYLMSDGT